MDCKKEQNKKNCNCSYDCNKKGICCECIAYHRARKELSACYFDEEGEKSYDRSIKHFIELNS
ncbi:MAG: hypothetical protein KAQ83_03455 [Nanoarchaeota archaeon]|nr:hypothetical protein [Nanoarchaeota archaeon]